MLYDFNFIIIQFINVVSLKERAGGGSGNEQGAELGDEGAPESPDQTRAGKEESLEASSRRTCPAIEVSKLNYSFLLFWWVTYKFSQIKIF